MPTHWIVSMHGAAYASNPQGLPSQYSSAHDLVKIPTGVTVNFYCNEREPLSSQLAYQLLKELTPMDVSKVVAKRAKESRFGDGQIACLDYWTVGDTWADQHGNASGIFKVGASRADGEAKGANDWVKLSEIFDRCESGDQIHWLACRVMR